MTTPSEVIVQESEKGRLTQEITVGTHTLWADEPKIYGGNDHGPSPYDFILAGLGACTSMTLRLYADMKKIPLTKVVVKLTIEKIYATDCENCENPQSKIDHISRTIELHGDLTVDQRAKLLDIANKCPVHRTLTSKISITTLLAL
jgi:putative redox protein